MIIFTDNINIPKNKIEELNACLLPDDLYVGDTVAVLSDYFIKLPYINSSLDRHRFPFYLNPIYIQNILMLGYFFNQILILPNNLRLKHLLFTNNLPYITLSTESNKKVSLLKEELDLPLNSLTNLLIYENLEDIRLDTLKGMWEKQLDICNLTIDGNYERNTYDLYNNSFRIFTDPAYIRYLLLGRVK